MDLQMGSWCGIPGLVRPCFDSSLSGKELRQEQKRKKRLKGEKQNDHCELKQKINIKKNTKLLVVFWATKFQWWQGF